MNLQEMQDTENQVKQRLSDTKQQNLDCRENTKKKNA
jgi:hypothetical protein